MDEQTGSPGANAENNGQRNGDEVRAEDGCQITYFSGFPIQTPKNVLPAYISWGIATWTFRTYLFLLSCTEAPTWQLDQGEEEEEANEGQQCTKGPSHRLRSLYEWQTGAATGRTSRRALSRDYEDAGQRVEQAAPEEKQVGLRSFWQVHTLSNNCEKKVPMFCISFQSIIYVTLLKTACTML